MVSISFTSLLKLLRYFEVQELNIYYIDYLIMAYAALH